MTRYFYTDPLAAAWMAKHFGMKFLIDETEEEQAEILFGESDVQWAHEALGVKAFPIHPDSLHLLEPKVGDILQRSLLVARISDHEDDISLPLARGHLKQVGRIIQRNGISFMWPRQLTAARNTKKAKKSHYQKYKERVDAMPPLTEAEIARLPKKLFLLIYVTPEEIAAHRAARKEGDR